MMEKGKLIVIDGSDGSGKKTQTDLLIKYFKDKKKKTSYYDFPQYYKTIFGKMIGRYLNGEFGEADEVSPYLASLMYAGDRGQAKDKIIKDLEQGKIVIANRYTQSSMGFQTAKIAEKSKKEKFINWLEELEYKTYGLPKADLVIYLYVPYKIAQELVDQKNRRKYTNMQRDIHEKNSEFLQRVEKQYISLSKKYPEWRLINCVNNDQMLSPQEISNLIIKEVE